MRLRGTLICATEDELRQVLAHLPEHLRLTRAEPGCLRFEVTQSPDNPLIWRVDERFADAAAFDAHQQRTRASPWFAATRTIRRDYQIFPD